MLEYWLLRLGDHRQAVPRLRADPECSCASAGACDGQLLVLGSAALKDLRSNRSTIPVPQVVVLVQLGFCFEDQPLQLLFQWVGSHHARPDDDPPKTVCGIVQKLQSSSRRYRWCWLVYSYR